MTIQAQIIAAMREVKRPVSATYIRERLGMTQREVGNALRRLHLSGWISKSGNSRTMVYAVKRYGTHKDGRGKSPGSKVGRAHANPHKAGIMSTFARGQHPKPVARTALEQAWGWASPLSPRLHEDKTCGPIHGGTVRPQEA